MWHVKLTNKPHPRPTPTYQSANSIMEKGNKSGLDQYYHTTIFSTVQKVHPKLLKTSTSPHVPKINLIKNISPHHWKHPRGTYTNQRIESSPKNKKSNIPSRNNPYNCYPNTPIQSSLRSSTPIDKFIHTQQKIPHHI